jgi:hypothetical protein
LLVLLPLLYISYHLTTKKKKHTTHDLTVHPFLGHLPVFLKNCSTRLVHGPHHR